MKNRILAVAALAMALDAMDHARDYVFGHRVIEAKLRFTKADAAQPVVDAEIEYFVDEHLAQNMLGMEKGVIREGQLTISLRTDARGEAVVPIVFRYKWELDEGGMKVDDTAIDAPEGAVRILFEGKWTDCTFPHLNQAGTIRLEWIDGREIPKK